MLRFGGGMLLGALLLALPASGQELALLLTQLGLSLP